jgi:radical SAM-linked protein
MPDTTAPAPVCKVRLRFAKTDDLRFLSHHDLMRLLERLLRRAGLPFRSTGGFHPKPKITFASALSLGIIGRQEVVEVEFDGELDPQLVSSQLQSLAPSGLSFFHPMLVPPKKTAQPVRAVYHFPLSPESRPDLAARLDELLAQRSLVISRTRNVPLRPAQEEPLAEERLDALTNAEPVQTKVELKKLDIRPFLRRLWRDEQGFWMDVYITNQGAARPEELLRLVDLEDAWLDGEAVLERTVLEIEDEVDPRSQAQPGNAQPRGSASMPVPLDSTGTLDVQSETSVSGKTMQSLHSLRERRLVSILPLAPQTNMPVMTGPTEQE